ncbi:MAG: MerR family transcriptional regulator [Bdellovibrionia bacterium]
MTNPTNKTSVSKIEIPERLYFRIGDVAELLGVRPHVLRYWESEFPIVAPQKSATGQRVYRRSDVETLVMIKHLLHEERYSIEGARKRIRELRKEGALRTYKQETVSGKSDAEQSSDQIAIQAATQVAPAQEPFQVKEEILSMARSLSALASMPLSDLFHF